MQTNTWRENLSTFFLILLLFGSALSRAETITVYGDENHAPLGYLDKGVPKGLLVEMFSKIARKTGDTYDIKMFPWPRAQMHAKEGPGALMNVSMNAQRLELFDFSEPMYFDDVVVVVLKSKAFAFDKLADLKGKVLGGTIDGSYGEEIDSAIRAKLFTVDHDSNPTNRLNKLLRGRIDAALIPGGDLGYESALSGDPALLAKRDQFMVLSKPLVHDPLYLAVAKSLNKKELIARFNKALKEIQK